MSPKTWARRWSVPSMLALVLYVSGTAAARAHDTSLEGPLTHGEHGYSGRETRGVRENRTHAVDRRAHAIFQGRPRILTVKHLPGAT